MILHKTLGVNPRLTFCPRCGGEGKELVLLGAANYKRKCSCGMVTYGAKSSDKCQGCGEKLLNSERIELTEHERVPGDLCDDCKKEIEEFKNEVEKGGVYFRCACGAQGVFKAGSETAKLVREKSGIKAPKKVGVEIESCPKCKEEG